MLRTPQQHLKKIQVVESKLFPELCFTRAYLRKEYL